MARPERVATKLNGLALLILCINSQHSEAKTICDICACENLSVPQNSVSLSNQTLVLNIVCENALSKIVSNNPIFSRGTKQIWLTIKDDKFTPFKLNKFKEIFMNRTLTRLNLDNNKIITVPGYLFHGFEALNSVSLSHNKISYLSNETFVGLTKLKNLEIAHNDMELCNLDVFLVSSIQKLNLHTNKIQEVIGSNRVESLKEIDLSNNLIPKLDKFSNAFPNAEVLNISNNLIINISNYFFLPLTKLKELDLSHNKLMYFDLNDIVLPSIRIINLEYNLLTRVTIMNSHSQLNILNLCHNKLTTSEILPRNNTVEIFNMANNLIVECKEVRNLKHIKVLDLSYNDIKEIPDELPASLRELDLSGNKISSIPRLTSKMNYLLKLDLSRTPTLKELGPNAFEDFFPKSSINNNCTVLNLSECTISKIHEQAFDGTNLCKINLSGNLINLLPKGSLNWTSIEMDIQRNPIHCTCNNQWLIDTLIPSLYERKASLLSDLRCSGPKRYYRKRLVHWYNHTSGKTLCQSSEIMVENNGNNLNTIKDVKMTTGISMILTFAFLGILAVLLVWLAFALKRKYNSSPRRNIYEIVN